MEYRYRATINKRCNKKAVKAIFGKKIMLYFDNLTTHHPSLLFPSILFIMLEKTFQTFCAKPGLNPHKRLKLDLHQKNQLKAPYSSNINIFFFI